MRWTRCRGYAGGDNSGHALLDRFERGWRSQSMGYGNRWRLTNKMTTASAGRVRTACSFSPGLFIEAVVNFLLLEIVLILRARRVSPRDGEGVGRVRGVVREMGPIMGAIRGVDVDQTQAAANGGSNAGIHASLERYVNFAIEVLSLQPGGHLLEPLSLDGAPASLTVSGYDAPIGIGRQAVDGVTAVSVNAIRELVTRVAVVKGQRPPCVLRPDLQLASVVRALLRHPEVVWSDLAHTHHQVLLSRRASGILSRAGKTPRQKFMKSHDSRASYPYVTQTLKYVTIAHISRARFWHELRQQRLGHPREFLSKPNIERRRNQRFAGHSLVGAANAPKASVRVRCRIPATNSTTMALASISGLRRTVPFLWARPSISDLRNNRVNVSRISIHSCWAAIIPWIG